MPVVLVETYPLPSVISLMPISCVKQIMFLRVAHFNLVYRMALSDWILFSYLAAIH